MCVSVATRSQITTASLVIISCLLFTFHTSMGRRESTSTSCFSSPSTLSKKYQSAKFPVNTTPGCHDDLPFDVVVKLHFGRVKVAGHTGGAEVDEAAPLEGRGCSSTAKSGVVQFPSVSRLNTLTKQASRSTRAKQFLATNQAIDARLRTGFIGKGTISYSYAYSVICYACRIATLRGSRLSLAHQAP